MRDWTIPPANRIAKPFSRLMCVLAVVVCGALAGPGLARAASTTPGLGDAEAQVQSALAQVDAVAPGAGAAVRPAVNQALAMAGAATAAAAQPPAKAPAPAAAPPAPAAAPSVPAPAQIVSDAVEPVLTALDVPTSSVPFIVSPGRASDAPPRSHTPISLAAPTHAAHAAVGRTRAASVTPAAAGAAFQAAALTTPRAAPAGESSSSRSSRRGRSGAAPAGAVLPQRPLPPVPPGPGQDVTAPAQAGGQGQLVPLLVAALAAVLVFTRFPFRTRLVPRSAFRRPRRVVLPVWHPG